jgi:hypothetical protein
MMAIPAKFPEELENYLDTFPRWKQPPEYCNRFELDHKANVDEDFYEIRRDIEAFVVRNKETLFPGWRPNLDMQVSVDGWSGERGTDFPCVARVFVRFKGYSEDSILVKEARERHLYEACDKLLRALKHDVRVKQKIAAEAALPAIKESFRRNQQIVVSKEPLPISEAPASSVPFAGRKDDAEKLRYDLVPPNAFEEVVRVLSYGAKKYADDNWKLVPDAEKRYTAAAMRHMEACRKGERLDSESGLPHLAHAACCLFFLLELGVETGVKNK